MVNKRQMMCVIGLVCKEWIRVVFDIRITAIVC